MLLDRGIAVAKAAGGVASDFLRGYKSANGAVTWLHANAKSVNVDPDRIALIGISKNGNAATGATVSRGIGTTNFGEPIQIAQSGQRAATDRVRCAVNLWGTTDLMQTDRLRGSTTGGAMDMTIAAAMSASAINYISKDDPPVLLLFPFDSSAHGWMSGHRFDAAYRSEGLESTLLLTGMGNWEDLAADFLAVHLQDRKTPTRVHLISGGNAGVAGPTNGWFTVVRFGDLSADLLVQYALETGAKTACNPLSGKVKIPAGQTTAEIVVQPQAVDAVSVSLVDDKAYEVGANRRAKINVLSGDPSGVYAVGTRPYAKAPKGKGLITIGRWGSLAKEITANYTVLGNAVAGTDYQPLPGKITIPAGARSVKIEVVPLRYPSRGQPYKSVAISLDAGGGYDFGPYCGAACVVIMDEGEPSLSDITDPFEGR
ncbi:MAG: hypothetical protein IMZ44_01630 [Planctomycetes bacterium]|nr:hypothetical protein [Planctomycetota bacterium]